MNWLIVGVGLIGGSFAMCLRTFPGIKSITGIGRSAKNMQYALENGIIDHAIPNTLADRQMAYSSADGILVAVWSSEIENIFKEIASSNLQKNILIMDAVSTKVGVVNIAYRTLGKYIDCFVPAHPIAGTEKSGAAASYKGLFKDKPAVLSPLPETSPQALEKAISVWQHCGARVVSLSADRHDQMLAVVSHFPHILAYLMMDTVLSQPASKELLDISGTGFRGMTRIAASDSEMWCSIIAENREHVLAEMERFSVQYEHVRSLIQQGDLASLKSIFLRATIARRLLGH